MDFLGDSDRVRRHRDATSLQGYDVTLLQRYYVYPAGETKTKQEVARHSGKFRGIWEDQSRSQLRAGDVDGQPGSGGRGRSGPLSAGASPACCRVAARRPKATKLGANPRLCRRVIADLEALYSPQQIAGRLAADFGDDDSMRISHETIYKSLYLQGRGELRRELARCLRSGRAVRKPQGRVEARSNIQGKVMISERPAEVADRAVPGAWEGDLIIGKNGRSAIGTMVERNTRFVMLLHLPGDHTAETVRAAMTAKLAELPDPPGPLGHLGSRQRDVRPRPFHDRNGHPGLLLRPPLALAARHQREHQRPPPPVLPQRHRPVGPQPRTPRRRRRQPQQPSPQYPRLYATIRKARRAPRCKDRLRPPRIFCLPDRRKGIVDGELGVRLGILSALFGFFDVVLSLLVVDILPRVTEMRVPSFLLLIPPSRELTLRRLCVLAQLRCLRLRGGPDFVDRLFQKCKKN
jgi:hypothetical protein